MKAYNVFLFSLIIVIGLDALNLKTPSKTTAPIRAASVTLTDTTFNPADWSVIEVSEGGATQTNRQEPAGGNPGAFRLMEHHLPPPPSAVDVGRVQVLHLYEAAGYDPSAQGAIEHIDYAEDTALLGLPWNQAGIASFAALVQGGRAYRSSNAQFLLVSGTTAWAGGSLPGLTASDFVALDGSAARPDFSLTGGAITFGYWRTSSRVGDTPVPYNQDLLIRHGIDNFAVTVHPRGAVACSIEPPTATKTRADREHTVTVTADGVPVAAQEVAFYVSGQSLGEGTTDTNGQVSFTYTKSATAPLGTDNLSAQGIYGTENFSCTAQVTWVNAPPVARDGVFVVMTSDSTSRPLGHTLDVSTNDSDPDELDTLPSSPLHNPLPGR